MQERLISNLFFLSCIDSLAAHQDATDIKQEVGF